MPLNQPSINDLNKKRVSSGISQLDQYLGGFFIGDNVIWYEDTGSFSSVFCLNFIQESLNQKQTLIYVSFDRSPKNVVSFLGPFAKNQNLTILDCFTNGKGNKSEVFETFYDKDGALWPYQVIKVNDPTTPRHVGEAMYGLHSNLTGEVHFIIDSLTGMQDLWDGEDQILKFYANTCPRLYELDTIAYWLVEKSAHSKKLKANINKIAQVVIDLSVHRGKSSLKILKAEKRNSKFLNEQHEYLCEKNHIAFEGSRQINSKFDLGANIKNLRLMRGLSQKRLAHLTGVTPSTISQVEKNLIYPSIPALFRIAESLSVDIATFFRNYGLEKNVYIYPENERFSTSMTKISKNDADANLLLPPDIELPVEPVIIKIHPGKKLRNHFFAHKGQELGYLISGYLEMTVKNKSYEVLPGDTVYLQKDNPDQWLNTGDNTAELLWFKFLQ